MNTTQKTLEDAGTGFPKKDAEPRFRLPRLGRELDGDAMRLFKAAAALVPAGRDAKREGGGAGKISQETLFAALALFMPDVAESLYGFRVARLPKRLVERARAVRLPAKLPNGAAKLPPLEDALIDLFDENEPNSPGVEIFGALSAHAVAYAVAADPEESVMRILRMNGVRDFELFREDLRDRFLSEAYRDAATRLENAVRTAKFVEEALLRELPNQARAIREISLQLRDFWTRPKGDNRPLSLILVGEHGCGKSRLAGALQRAFVAARLQKRVRAVIDGASFNDREMGVVSLLGSNPSYKNAEEGLLHRVFAESPRGCVVFDNPTLGHASFQTVINSFVCGDAFDKFLDRSVRGGNGVCVSTISLEESACAYLRENARCGAISPLLLSRALSPGLEKNENSVEFIFRNARKIVLLDSISESVLREIGAREIAARKKEFAAYGIALSFSSEADFVELNLRSAPALPRVKAFLEGMAADFSGIYDALASETRARFSEFRVECAPVPAYPYDEKRRASRGDRLVCVSRPETAGTRFTLRKTEIRYERIREGVENEFACVAMKHTDFRDLVGLDAAVSELRDAIDFVKNPKAYDELGVPRPETTFLFYGPPGTGKTSLAIAAAREADLPLYVATSRILLSPTNIRELFGRANKAAPAVVILEEFNTFGNAAYGGDACVINQLNAELDGVEKKNSLIVIASTNYPEQIDPALLRGKRFSKKIEVPLPDSASREEIFERTLRRYGVAATPHAREVFLESADGKSAADIVCDVENAVFKFKRHETPLEETFRKLADARTGVRRLGFVSGR